ncbi:MAG: hypothetical protein ACI9LU_000412 [Polaribacter sp.]|jgi:hypothetical protein
MYNDYPASIVLKIADQLLSGEIELSGADHSSAVAAFEKAMIAQDSLPYTEPLF